MRSGRSPSLLRLAVCGDRGPERSASLATGAWLVLLTLPFTLFTSFSGKTCAFGAAACLRVTTKTRHLLCVFDNEDTTLCVFDYEDATTGLYGSRSSAGFRHSGVAVHLMGSLVRPAAPCSFELVRQCSDYVTLTP